MPENRGPGLCEVIVSILTFPFIATLIYINCKSLGLDSKKQLVLKNITTCPACRTGRPYNPFSRRKFDASFLPMLVY
uniref:Uncharacterized protein n=1 Tax=Salix viminalis TaxID=40686 RepID=A0A6N2NEJ6_SALVM